MDANTYNGDPQNVGELLGESGNADYALQRKKAAHWTVVRVYTRLGGGYLTDIVGRSRFEDQPDRHKTTTCATAQDVIESMLRVDPVTGKSYLPHVRRYALWQAAEVDFDLQDAIEAHEATE